MAARNPNRPVDHHSDHHFTQERLASLEASQQALTAQLQQSNTEIKRDLESIFARLNTIGATNWQSIFAGLALLVAAMAGLGTILGALGIAMLRPVEAKGEFMQKQFDTHLVQTQPLVSDLHTFKSLAERNRDRIAENATAISANEALIRSEIAGLDLRLQREMKDNDDKLFVQLTSLTQRFDKEVDLKIKADKANGGPKAP